MMHLLILDVSGERDIQHEPGRQATDIGGKKQALLRDLEYVVSSLDKYLQQLTSSHSDRVGRLLENVIT